MKSSSWPCGARSNAKLASPKVSTGAPPMETSVQPSGTPHCSAAPPFACCWSRHQRTVRQTRPGATPRQLRGGWAQLGAGPTAHRRRRTRCTTASSVDKRIPQASSERGRATVSAVKPGALASSGDCQARRGGALRAGDFRMERGVGCCRCASGGDCWTRMAMSLLSVSGDLGMEVVRVASEAPTTHTCSPAAHIGTEDDTAAHQSASQPAAAQPAQWSWSTPRNRTATSVP